MKEGWRYNIDEIRDISAWKAHSNTPETLRTCSVDSKLILKLNWIEINQVQMVVDAGLVSGSWLAGTVG